MEAIGEKLGIFDKKILDIAVITIKTANGMYLFLFKIFFSNLIKNNTIFNIVLHSFTEC